MKVNTYAGAGRHNPRSMPQGKETTTYGQFETRHQPLETG